jgi:DeoR/GlpR family transcriptional regulator of sugar metabolism
MLTRQRKRWILERLECDGQLVAADASRELGVSEDTMRRDLRALAAQGLLQRVHGGALPASRAIATLAERQRVEPEGKRAIAIAAAGMIQAGQVVFLDGGTSCRQLARALPPGLAVTVVTHSPTVAAELAGHAFVEIILIGGRVFRHSMVAVGAAAVEMINRINIDVYFMGVTGIDARAGLSTGDMEEAQVKRTILARAAETWVLASAEKLNAASAYVIAPCHAVSGLIVEAGTPPAALAALEALGLAIVRA